MSELSHSVASNVSACFRTFAARARELSEGLDEEAFWSSPLGYGNSMGVLVLHLTGNLSHFVGAQMARSGYVRHRDREFTAEDHGTMAETLDALDRCVEAVVVTVDAQTEADWTAPYSAPGMDGELDRFGMVLRCLAHFHHHVGQMIYLRMALDRRG